MDKPYLSSILALRVGRTGSAMVHRAGQVNAASAEQARTEALRLCCLVFPALR